MPSQRSQWPAPVSAAAERCPRELTGDECYQRLGAIGLQYGPEFRGLSRLWLGDREAVAELRCPSAGAGTYRVPPQLLDSALQVLAVLATFEPQAPGSALLPTVIQSVRISRRPPENGLCHVTLKQAGDDGTRMGRVRLFDLEGNEVIDVEGLVLRPSGGALTSRDWARERVLSVKWEARTQAARPASPGRRWLWLAGEADAARALLDALRAQGRRDLVMAWPRGGAPEAISEGLTAPPPGTGWEAVLDAADVERAVWLTAPLQPEDVEVECGRVLELCRGSARSRSSRLLVATFGAQATAPDPSQAALWGVLRVFAREHPNRWGGLVDFPEAFRTDAWRVVAAAVDASDAEVAVRGGVVMEPRLQRLPLPPPPSQEPIRKDATYLITGGLGGVGLALSGWLADRGAAHLVLVGRRAPSPEASAAISALERRGVKVRVVQGDVGRAEDVARALAEPGALGWPAVKGVFHLAVSLADGVIQALEPAQVRTALAPKVSGGWNLHRATASLPLDHFVLFSSIAALGTPGQAAYAAGSAFMDALAHRRRAEGLPALSVGFGAFGEIGAAARLEAHGGRGAPGVENMPPARALDALGALLASPEPHAFVASASWPAFAEGLPSGAGRLYASLLEAARPQEPASAGGQEYADWIRAQPARARKDALEGHVRQHVTRILGLALSQAPAPDHPLMMAGLDSLMTTQLRNALNASLRLDLSVTLLFDHPTIATLATHLSEVVGAESTPTQPASAPTPAAATPGTPVPSDDLESVLSELEQLPEEEVARRLRGDPSKT